ncbi:hypothetical protein FRC18_006960 [Serendipita sp. 400]|nr:hypothetical protein FRC18_006960 [Serendipita sp. 400]
MKRPSHILEKRRNTKSSRKRRNRHTFPDPLDVHRNHHHMNALPQVHEQPASPMKIDVTQPSSITISIKSWMTKTPERDHTMKSMMGQRELTELFVGQ